MPVGVVAGRQPARAASALTAHHKMAHDDRWASSWAFKPIPHVGPLFSAWILPLITDPTAPATPGVDGPGRGMKTPTSPTTPSPRSPPLPPAVGARSRVRVRGCTAARTFPLPPENVHGTGACRAPGRHPPSHGRRPVDQCAALRPASGDRSPRTRRARS